MRDRYSAALRRNFFLPDCGQEYCLAEKIYQTLRRRDAAFRLFVPSFHDFQR